MRARARPSGLVEPVVRQKARWSDGLFKAGVLAKPRTFN